MKTLYLLRHAKSSWKKRHLSDQKRPLNRRGKRVLPLMAAAGVLKHEMPFTIYSSMATRAIDTIKGLVEYSQSNNKINVDEALYTFSANNLLRWLRHLQQEESGVMLVGHNPAIDGLVTLLTGERLTSYPTCAISEIQLDINEWSDISENSGKLVSFLKPAWVSYPEFIRKQPDESDWPDFASDYVERIDALMIPSVLGHDDEFLHKVRVNARKLLAYLKGYGEFVNGGLDLEPVITLARDIIKASNAVRDLDVMLQAVNDWQKTIEEINDANMQELADCILNLRHAANEKYKQLVQSEAYKQRVKQGKQICLQLDEKIRPDDRQTVLYKKSAEQLESLKKNFSKLHGRSDDKRLHKIRIQLKNLRYLLRLVGNADPEIINKLSLLQEFLGGYHDCAVQQSIIKTAAEQVGTESIRQTSDRIIRYLEGEKKKFNKKILNSGGFDHLS